MRKLILLIFVVLMADTAFCQEVSQDTIHAAERIQSIQLILDQSKTNVDIWWYGWLGTYSAATVGQLAVSATSNDLATRQDMILGAGTTALGAAFQLLTPMHVRVNANKLANMPENTDAEKRLKLKAAETYLYEIAQLEKSGRSWQIHAINSAVNLGSGLITWIGFKRSVWDGVANFMLNTIITETQIWTQPTRAYRAYRRYQSKYIDKQEFRKEPVNAELYFKTYPSGVLVGVKF